MTDKPQLELLTRKQIVALLQHYVEVDQVRLAHNNALSDLFMSDPDQTEGQRKLLAAWAEYSNEISQKSDAEVERIAAGQPRVTN